MLSINQVVLVGNLVRDAEVFDRKNGSKAVRMRVAVSRFLEDGRREVDFFDVVKFNGLPSQYALSKLVRGAAVAIAGELRKRKSETGSGDQVYVVANVLSIPENYVESDNESRRNVSSRQSQGRLFSDEEAAPKKQAVDVDVLVDNDPFV